MRVRVARRCGRVFPILAKTEYSSQVRWVLVGGGRLVLRRSFRFPCFERMEGSEDAGVLQFMPRSSTARIFAETVSAVKNQRYYDVV